MNVLEKDSVSRERERESNCPLKKKISLLRGGKQFDSNLDK